MKQKGGVVGAAIKYLRGKPALNVPRLVVLISRTEEPQKILDHLVDYISDFGATWITLGHVVNADRFKHAKPLKLTNTKLDFLEAREPHQAIIHDPVLNHVLRRSTPFFWHEVFAGASPEGEAFLRMASAHGLKDGITFPMDFAGRPMGAVSIAGRHIVIDPDELHALSRVLTFGYRRLEDLCGPYNLEPQAHLSVLETEVLHFAASGKSSWETATILGKTETSVSAAIKRAIRKLDAANRAEAVAKALTQRLIL